MELTAILRCYGQFKRTGCSGGVQHVHSFIGLNGDTVVSAIPADGVIPHYVPAGHHRFYFRQSRTLIYDATLRLRTGKSYRLVEDRFISGMEMNQ